MPAKRWSVDLGYPPPSNTVPYAYAAGPPVLSPTMTGPGYGDGGWYGFTAYQPPHYPQAPPPPVQGGYWTMYPAVPHSPMLPPNLVEQTRHRRASYSHGSQTDHITSQPPSSAFRNPRYGDSKISPLPAGLNLPEYFQVRGPPRKPRHGPTSMWVGNVPKSTNLIELRDLFSIGCKDHLQSVFWMAKTNCAFVNYNTVSSCMAAVDRFNQYVFKGIQLNCRLRENGVTQDLPLRLGDSSPRVGKVVKLPSSVYELTPPTSVNSQESLVNLAKQRYFVAKSLTRDDLVASTRNGLWTTQSRIGKVLEQALKDSEEVFLVFSANRSGQYFGYAQVMKVEPHTKDGAASADAKSPIKSTSSATPPSHMIRCIDIPETDNAVAGTIYDDSERGILYWESRRSIDYPNSTNDECDIPEINDDFNRSGFLEFAVKWISTRPVSFHRTRNLFNSLNDGRPVKIAKDGTEIDTQTAKALMRLWQ